MTWKTIARRFLILIPQLIVLSLLIFILAQIMPGDALRGLVGPDVPAERIQELRAMHGLDDPWYIQYARWITAIIFEGDFGQSLTHRRPVTVLIGERVGNTVRLSFLTALLTYLIAVPLGIIAAKRKGTAIDRGIMIYTFVSLSIPTVVFALINLLMFSLRLGWFPVSGSVDATVAAGTFAHYASRLHHMILPAITLALISTTGVVYFLRGEIIDYETSDFVTTARSKGVPENKVYTRHILRNAILPVLGSAGPVIISMFAGSVFIESVFAYPGMGQLFIQSIISRDFPVVNILIMFYAIITVVAMLITDILITFVDPRIRIK